MCQQFLQQTIKGGCLFFFSFKEKQKGRALRIPFNAGEKKNQREKDVVKLSQVNFKE